jgi:hypothetical protein
VKEVFETKFTPEPNTGCWLWDGFLSPRGYGKVLHNKKRWRAHRLAYALYIGEIPEGFFVCHKCDNPTCVNPQHLFLGTAQDNMDDMVTKERSMRGTAHHKSKITESDVLKIRADKRSQQAIADEYGLSQTGVGLIKNRINWRHV